MRFLERLFSVKNNDKRDHKVVTLLGIQFKFKNDKKIREEEIKKIKIFNEYLSKRKIFYHNIVNDIINDVKPESINLKQARNKILFNNYKNLYSRLDPLGSILIKDGEFYRGIYKHKCDYFIDLWNKGIIQSLIRHNIIVDIKISDYFTDEFPIILKTKKISMVSPYFWTYSMFKAVSINSLILLKVLNHFGYSLIDGHSGNTRFDNNKAKWIDIGSIIPTTKNKNTINEILVGQIVQLCMMSFPSKFYYAHRLYSELNNTLCIDVPFINSIEYNFIINYFINNCKNMHQDLAYKLLINQELEPEYIDVLFNYTKSDTIWTDYSRWDMSDINNFSCNNRFYNTINIIKKFAPNIQSSIDIAGNSGFFSALLKKKLNLKNIISLDYCEDAIEYGIKKCYENNINVNFGLLNFMIPTHTPSLKDLKSDLVIALAITHHLILTQGYNIDSIFNMISKYTNKYACIEFCPLGMYSDQDFLPQVPEWYTQDWFEEHMKKFFDIKNVSITNKVKIENKEYSHRILYICELKTSETIAAAERERERE